MNTLTFDDVLLVPPYNNWESRKVVDISNTCKRKKLALALPLMTAKMDTITEAEMADFMGAKGGIGVLHRVMSVEKNEEIFKACRYPTFVSAGPMDDEMRRVEALRDAGAEFFCVDVAHAHARYVGRVLKRMREMLPMKSMSASKPPSGPNISASAIRTCPATTDGPDDGSL